MKKILNRLTIICLSFFFLTLSSFFNFILVYVPHYVLLANSFIQGKLYFLNIIDKLDTAYFNGHYYWPLGPFPAILLIPFVLFIKVNNLCLLQSVANSLLVSAIFYSFFKIARKAAFSTNDSLYLTYAFCFSSAFIGVAFIPWSSFFAHNVVTTLIGVALAEYFAGRRYWLIGFLMGLVTATRLFAGLGILFFTLAIFNDASYNHFQKLKNLIYITSPVLITLSILGIYNLARFGNIWNPGYSSQILTETLLKIRHQDVLSIKHVPENIYYFLFSGPKIAFKNPLPSISANPWGMSIFLTSPYFIYLFFLRFKDKLSKILIITIIVIAIPELLFFGKGYMQFGYRFSLDFLPFLFILLIRNYKLQYKRLSTLFKSIIILSSLSNFYLLLTLIFSVYKFE